MQTVISSKRFRFPLSQTPSTPLISNSEPSIPRRMRTHKRTTPAPVRSPFSSAQWTVPNVAPTAGRRLCAMHGWRWGAPSRTTSRQHKHNRLNIHFKTLIDTCSVAEKLDRTGKPHIDRTVGSQVAKYRKEVILISILWISPQSQSCTKFIQIF